MKLRNQGEPSGSGAGSVGNPAAQQGGVSDDPFQGLDLEDLDPATRKVIEDSKAKFASLQKTVADKTAAVEQADKQAKHFQALYDRDLAEFKKGHAPTPPDPQVEQIGKLTKILVSKGVSPDNAKVQAELMHEMMGEFASTIKADIGRDLAPLATSVVVREAELSWSQAEAQDRVGVFAIPDVTTQARTQVQALIDQGSQVTPQIINNLVGMAYLQHLQKGGAPAGASAEPMPQPQLPNIGRSSFTGGGAQPFRPTVPDPTAPKHRLDAATDAALQTVYSKWDVKPKAFRGGK